jgi:hypothetical protein
MHALSKAAGAILDRMEPEHSYAAKDLRAFVPDTSPETLAEIMHELWVSREVERVGDSGWRRHRSASPHDSRGDARPDGSVSRRGQTKLVKPEELFDHDAFADFFR